MGGDTRVVTVQQWQPLLVGVLRGLLAAVVGAAGGVLGLLQHDSSANAHAIIMAALIGALAGFIPLAGGGLIDQQRAATVSPLTRVGDVVAGTSEGGTA